MHGTTVGNAAVAVDRIDEALRNAEGTFRSPRMVEAGDTGAVDGEVYWKPVKSAWISGMTLTALIGGPLLITWGAFVLFLATTAVTVCLGHSLGMHRRLIHRAYDCPLWLERLFVYLGTLVGMAGPYGMVRQHDIRDWAQRKPACHPYLAHRSGLLRDGYWQLHCELRLAHLPQLVMERRVAEDRFYRFLERTWMAQQLPWAALFFALGGLPWVVWGIAARVAASVTGHWLVGYFAHNRGGRRWHVEGAGVQGYNVPYCGLITMGEAWHNNHHAFPASACLGLYKGETDPGWWVLRVLMAVGLVWNAKTPETLPMRPNLVALRRSGE
ncbi:MAG TPA: acyl-CoA desaturase [Hyphomicrobiaceae bacterium]|jgi:stearoyl-CoA desaturase (delta-9 desaturase)|nr:acyl-CoA desaturase [Hyphomicrobiaceae bacterium]